MFAAPIDTLHLQSVYVQASWQNLAQNPLFRSGLKQKFKSDLKCNGLKMQISEDAALTAQIGFQVEFFPSHEPNLTSQQRAERSVHGEAAGEEKSCAWMPVTRKRHRINSQSDAVFIRSGNWEISDFRG